MRGLGSCGNRRGGGRMRRWGVGVRVGGGGIVTGEVVMGNCDVVFEIGNCVVKGCRYWLHLKLAARN